jgi:hypothetical protein
MPTAVLREHQYEILSGDETRSLVFGTEDTGYLTLTRPKWNKADMRVGDVEASQEDGIQFGRDFSAPKSVTFEMGVLTDARNALVPVGGTAHSTNLDYLNAVETWWTDRRLRTNPWDYAVLRCCEDGSTYRAYGRPRRYEEMAGNFTKLGYTPVMADFQLLDDRVYTDVVSSASATLQQADEGGLMEPLMEPLSTVGETTGKSFIEVGGSRETWVWVEFTGPVTNPRATIGDLEVGLNATIPSDTVTVTIDPRPWSRGVLRNDGASLAGATTSATPQMKELLVWPGRHEVTYTGSDVTGTSVCRVFWRSARSRP